MKWPLIKILPHHFSFNFVKLTPFAAALSLALLIGSGVLFFTKGLNLGTDFAGGTLMEIATPGRAAPLSDLRATMARVGVHDAQIQGFGRPGAALLRFKTADNPTEAAAEKAKVKAALTQQFPGIEFTRDETVGGKVSGELQVKGGIALGVAILLMLLYIWFRFQLQFGLGAVLAIAHDVALTLGLLCLTQVEFSMTSIAALLTIIGYSMNEKVITFDRLRENLRKYKKTPLAEVINLSENERLSRTLITGTTALLALSGMLFLGGPALFSLIMTMVFGIIIGTYSSIYVALPVILLWGVRRGDEEATVIKPMTSRY